MSLSVYNMLSEETPYTFPQHRTILNQTGCVGVLEAKADPGTGGFVSTWQGSTVCVLHNTSMGQKTIDLAALGLDFDTLAAVVGMGEAELNGASLVLGGQTSVVLR